LETTAPLASARPGAGRSGAPGAGRAAAALLVEAGTARGRRRPEAAVRGFFGAPRRREAGPASRPAGRFRPTGAGRTRIPAA